MKVDNANLYLETAGQGQSILFLHAGVADSRQWNNEFQHFSKNYCVTRYDQRGFGRSPPVAGDFSYLGDLVALVDHLQPAKPVILVGCSMGGMTAIDMALEHPDKVKALVLVDSAPAGLDIDVPVVEKFRLAEEAGKAGDLERVAEIETQIWFDGDRVTESVNPEMRALAQLLPNYRQITIDDAAHLPNMDQPEQFQQGLEQFLGALS